MAFTVDLNNSGTPTITNNQLSASGQDIEINCAGHTLLGAAAFQGWNRIRGVTFINSGLLTTINNVAFASSGITSIEIPTTVQNLGVWAFEACTFLTTVTFTGGATQSTLQAIPNHSFYNSGVTTFDIPQTVTSIEQYAFGACNNLTSVTFVSGSLLTTIAESAFSYSGLVSFEVPSGVTTISDNAFAAASSLLTFTFANNSQLTTIGTGVFTQSGITGIEIPSGVTVLNSAMFHLCSNLSSVTFATGSQLTTIESSVFSNSGLVNIEIPSTIQSIAVWAFGYCQSLTTVTFAGEPNLAIINEHCFYNANALASIDIPASVTSINLNAFGSCNLLTTVTFKTGSLLTTIADSAFANTGILEITLPENLETIGEKALSLGTPLQIVNFEGNAVDSIGPDAFGQNIDFSPYYWTLYSTPFNGNTTYTTLDTHFGTSNYNGSPTFVYGGASIAGDPYVTPIYGPQYKLPDREACYRLFERGNVFINGLVKEASEQKQQAILDYAQSLYAKHASTLDVAEASKLLSLDNLLLNGYFFDAFLIYSEDKVLFVDLINKQFKTDSQEYFAIEQKDKKSVGISNTNLYKNSKYTKVTVNWKHSEFGNMNSFVSFYDNPQIDNGISISKASTTKDCVGLLMYNYKPKLMEIPKLTTLTHKKLHKRLKNAKNKFINKRILLKSEEWRSISANAVKTLENKDIRKY
jgi:hypothetical protein